MKNSKLFTLPLICALLSLFHPSYAQGWEHKYSPDLIMGINSVYQLPNNTYLASGLDYTFAATKQRLMSYDANGGVLWQQDYDSIMLAGTNIAQNNGYVMLGFGLADSLVPVNLLKVNAAGQRIWLKTIDTTYAAITGVPILSSLSVDTTNDGGFICTYNPWGITPQTYNRYWIVVKRIDSLGNILWSKNYYGTDSAGTSMDIRNAGDGGFLVTAYDYQGDTTYSVFKIDSTGNQLWVHHVPVNSSTMNAVIAADGNILISGAGYIGKLDQNGNTLWLTQNYPALQNNMVWTGNLVEISHNRFALLAAQANTNRAYTGGIFSFTEADSAGNIILQHLIPTVALGTAPQLFALYSRNMIASNDGGYVLSGLITQDPDNNSAFLIKMDSSGQVFRSNISGYTYDDANNNCIHDTGEINLAGTIIRFANARDTFTVATGDSGYYSLQIDTGTFNILVTIPSPYWGLGNCIPAQINIPNNTDTVASFGLTALVLGPYISMDAYMSSITCHYESQYNLQYCNTGTTPFTGIIAVTIDTLAIVDSASKPWQLPQTGNQYIFKVDTLGISDCNNLIIYYHLNCGGDITGTDFCINAHAYSDTVICLSPLWDHSNLQITAACNSARDSVQFTLKNAGTGNMQQPESMIVIEDNVILIMDPEQLVAGQINIFSEPANGSTWRVSIPQTPANPYSSFTTAAMEGCGTTPYHLGYITSFHTIAFTDLITPFVAKLMARLTLIINQYCLKGLAASILLIALSCLNTQLSFKTPVMRPPVRYV
jgi:hypothetical protein